jgi:SAM-dependent methyltransferase
MGRQGKPGASLRAFRDYLPRACIYGADVDTRILFEEDRIKTFFVDQTDLASLESLGRRIAGDFDLIIDDGLHSPNANIAVLAFALKRLKPGGWVVIEDIVGDAAPVWHVVAALLPQTFEPHLVAIRKGGVAFAVRRHASGDGNRT